MSLISIFSSTFCNSGKVVKKLAEKTGYSVITDKDVVSSTSKLSGISEKKIERVFSDKASIFNKFTHEKERSVAYIKLALAQIIAKDDLLIDGFSGLLIPAAITHMLRICLISDMRHRTSAALKEMNISEKDAAAFIHKEDEKRAAWVYHIMKNKDPWDPSIYDMVIPTEKMTADEIISLIEENLKSEIIKPTQNSKKAANDFLMAANVEVALSKEGHAAEVDVRDGNVVLTINNNVLMLNRLEDDLKVIVGKVQGVASVETRIGKGFYNADIYRKFDFEAPSKVLLVDDEREFVQTLSERLLIRDVGSVIAYDGESALEMLEQDEPEVMILDLKMPGIDGIQVLRKVKEMHPNVEVIILTGHGTEKDKETCMQLGAFAYLQKPVDIDTLNNALKKANEKIKQNAYNK